MKGRLTLTSCALMLSLGGALAVGGHSAPRVHAAPGFEQVCTANADLGFGSHGACVSYFESMTSSGFPHSSAYFAAYCSMWTYPGYVFDPYAGTYVYFTNRGQCVKYANQHYKP